MRPKRSQAVQVGISPEPDPSNEMNAVRAAAGQGLGSDGAKRLSHSNVDRAIGSFAAAAAAATRTDRVGSGRGATAA